MAGEKALRLAIDTSAQFCAVAVYDTGSNRVLGSRTEDIGRGHAEILMGILAETLAASEAEYSDLTEIVATAGPGSFTGVRVGLATARGLALSLNLPVAGISTLRTCQLFAKSLAEPPSIVTLIDARRNEVYAQIDDKPPFVATYERLADMVPGEDFVLCGSGAKTFNELNKCNFTIVHDRSVAPIEFIAAQPVEAGASHPEPLYLRSADAKPQQGFVLKKASM